VTATPGNENNPVWAPDGRSLAFSADGDAGTAVRRKGLRASEPETVLVDSPDQDFPESRSGDGEIDEPQLSPDGRWLAYMSSESGRYEVYAEPFRRDGDRVRVSVDGGGQPRWRGDGRELFYATPRAA
jgi:Tol biopolymer transport system component